ETLLMMMFLMLMVFGLIHLSMIATTKYMVNFAAFSAGRAAMIGNSAQVAAANALLYVRWSGPVCVPPTCIVDSNASKTIRGKTRTGVSVRYFVPFGGFFGNALPFLSGFSPFEKQPDVKEEGDNV